MSDPTSGPVHAASRPPTPFADRATRPTRRAAVLAAAPVLTLGGAGAAAAAVLDWSPWAQQPDVAFTYTLPSGATCAQRLGNVTAADPAVADGIERLPGYGSEGNYSPDEEYVLAVLHVAERRVLDEFLRLGLIEPGTKFVSATVFATRPVMPFRKRSVTPAPTRAWRCVTPWTASIRNSRNWCG